MSINKDITLSELLSLPMKQGITRLIQCEEVFTCEFE